MKYINPWAILLSASFICFACVKAPLTAALPAVTPENVDTVKIPQPTKVTTTRKVVEIGKGEGTISISGKRNLILVIKPGLYSGITIKNSSNVRVEGQNVVIQRGNLDISDVDSLEVDGIAFQNHDQAAIYIHTRANNLTLKNLSFTDIFNYCIRFDVRNKYDGTRNSISKNIELRNIKGENIGSLFVSYGEILPDGFYGLIRKFRLQNAVVKNSPHLNGLTSLGLAEGYVLSHNTVDNVNASDKFPSGNNDHTAIFFARGNGKVHNNRITNHQGNAVRAWPLTISEPGEIEIYNNIVYNSTRYGAFELQVNDITKSITWFKPANAKIYNNTVGRLNTGRPKFFQGRLLDLYQTYGEVELYNNLSFDMFDSVLVNNMSDPLETKIKRNSNNIYFKNWRDAVKDLQSFESKIKGVGAR